MSEPTDPMDSASIQERFRKLHRAKARKVVHTDASESNVLSLRKRPQGDQGAAY